MLDMAGSVQQLARMTVGDESDTVIAFARAAARLADPFAERAKVPSELQLDETRWRQVADRFLEAFAAQEVRGRPLDVRENVRFRGGELSSWINGRYAGRGCALAIEFKKVFMDEWTGELDEEHLTELRGALVKVLPELLEAVQAS